MNCPLCGKPLELAPTAKDELGPGVLCTAWRCPTVSESDYGAVYHYRRVVPTPRT